jgi:hypothetical protein
MVVVIVVVVVVVVAVSQYFKFSNIMSDESEK